MVVLCLRLGLVSVWFKLKFSDLQREFHGEEGMLVQWS